MFALARASSAASSSAAACVARGAVRSASTLGNVVQTSNFEFNQMDLLRQEGPIRTVTYEEVDKDATALVKGLLELGYDSSTCIGVWGPGAIDTYMAQAAAVQAGWKLVNFDSTQCNVSDVMEGIVANDVNILFHTPSYIDEGDLDLFCLQMRDMQVKRGFRHRTDVLLAKQPIESPTMPSLRCLVRPNHHDMEPYMTGPSVFRTAEVMVDNVYPFTLDEEISDKTVLGASSGTTHADVHARAQQLRKEHGLKAGVPLEVENGVPLDDILPLVVACIESETKLVIPTLPHYVNPEE